MPRHYGTSSLRLPTGKKIARPAAKRETVACLKEQFQISERRACEVIAADRKMVRYHSRRPPETELRARLQELANERRRCKARRRAIGVRTPILVAAEPNARWSLDFVRDQMANGRKFRVLNITDDVTHECLGAIPDTSISGHRVARELSAIIARSGKPE